MRPAVFVRSRLENARHGLVRTIPFLGLTAVLFAAPGDTPAPKPVRSEKIVGRQIPAFVLPDANGKQIGLFDFFSRTDWLVVAFTGTRCPVGNAYLPILEDIRKDYRDKKVEVVGINPNAGDTADAVKKHVADFKIDFPVLIDPRQTTVPMFGVARTPEVFVLDRRGVVRYHGRVDDRFGVAHRRDEARRNDLREALDELLAGKSVSVPETEPDGCLITPVTRTKKGEVTFAKHVAPILQKQCADCHHSGTAAPFALLTYEDAVNWSAMMADVVARRQMPPWHADPRFGHFANERRLTPDEIDTILSWVAAGTPRGDEKDLPPSPTFTEGWRIGKPDQVFAIAQQTVPAKGKVAYRYLTTKTDFKQDMWVQAAEVRPGNRAVVHHIIVYARPSPKAALEWITAIAPGADPLVLPEGLGRKIPAGAELVWQIHYTTTGKEETDRSEIGLVFCKEKPKHPVVNHGIANTRFKIPPGAPNHKVVAEVPAFRDGMLLDLFPHMHLRGKDIEYRLIYPDGKDELILSVPQYDFNWQHTYHLQEPLRVPKGSIVRVTAHFDNSAANPANPDPKAEVRFGEQTWEEMMIGYIDFWWDDQQIK